MCSVAARPVLQQRALEPQRYLGNFGHFRWGYLSRCLCVTQFSVLYIARSQAIVCRARDMYDVDNDDEKCSTPQPDQHFVFDGVSFYYSLSRMMMMMMILDIVFLSSGLLSRCQYCDRSPLCCHQVCRTYAFVLPTTPYHQHWTSRCMVDNPSRGLCWVQHCF